MSGRIVGTIMDEQHATDDDEVLGLEAAAKIMGITPSALRTKRDVPRVRYPGRGTGKRSKPLYLKSQCLAYARRYLTHRIDDAATDAIVKRAAEGAARRLARGSR